MTARKKKPETIPAPPLSPRVEPTQARAVETRERILEAAAQILEESGADGLTTKKAAERAGVRIRSVYRYFPNKLAIIYALASRITETEEELLALYEELGQSPDDWRPLLGTLLETFFVEGNRIPGLRAIRAAMQVSPELRRIDDQMNQRHIAALSAALAARGSDLPQERRDVVAGTLVETATRLLDRAWLEMSLPGGEGRAALWVEEMKQAMVAYIDLYL